MRWINGRGLNCLQFPSLAALPDFFHGVFLRPAQNAPGLPYDCNVGLGHGTPESQVRQNREAILAFFGADISALYANQVHGKDVAVLKKAQGSKRQDKGRSVRLNGDALITNQAGMALMIQVADCQPIMLIDPENGVVGNVHSGWRGSIQNIIGATVGLMRTDFGCRPEDLLCAIGPSLGPCCAEFVNYREEIPEPFWTYRRSDNLFDFWQVSVDQLVSAGVPPDNISLAGMCTKCNQHIFFSYRGERHTGRFAAVVGIRPGKGKKA